MGCVFYLVCSILGGFSSRFIIHDLVFFPSFSISNFDARIITLLPSVILFETRLVAKGAMGSFFSFLLFMGSVWMELL